MEATTISLKEYRVIPTHIEKLDEILGGGFLRPGLVYIVGNPGTGKTLLAFQYLYNRAVQDNEAGLYLQLSEPRSLMLSRMSRFKCFDRFHEIVGLKENELKQGKRVIIYEASPLYEKGMINDMLNYVIDSVEEGMYKNIVIDSITSITLHIDPKEARSLLTMLFRRVAELDVTLVLIGEKPLFAKMISPIVEEFVSDIVLYLDYIKTVGYGARIAIRMTPIKMRAAQHERRFFEVNISMEKGFVIMPEYPPDSEPLISHV